MESNPNQPKIVKSNLSEIVFVDKCGLGNPKNSLQMTSTEFKENVALLDVRVRGINPNKHINEITLVDFSKHKFGNMKRRIVFNGLRFADEGTGHDLVAHDGIYTSIKVFNNGNKYSSLKSRKSERILPNPIVDSKFKHQAALQTIIDNSNSGLNPDVQGFFGSITCDIEFGTNGCRANELGWCENCCATISNCSVTLGWN